MKTTAHVAGSDSDQHTRRVVIVGVSGSGKTTIARALARALRGPHIELDALCWGPNWTKSPTPVMRSKIEALTATGAWVVDGNYGELRDITWGRADTLVWLDYRLTLVLWRLLRRILSRLIRREVLWNANRETWRGQFLSRDSLFAYAVQSHYSRRKRYPQLLQTDSFRHLRVVRLCSPRAAARWLDRVGGRAAVGRQATWW